MAKPKLTKGKFRKALDGSGGNITLIAQSCGVTRQTVHNYLNRYPDLRKELEDETNRITDVARGHLVNRVIDDEWNAVKFWLLTKSNGEFSYRAEVSGPGGGPIQTESRQIFDLGNGVKIEF